MAVPKRRHSNSRTGKRRSHHSITPKQTGLCRTCNTAVPTHSVCPKCGHYMGRTVVETTENS